MNFEQPNQNKKEQEMTRRGFLKGMAATGTAAVVGAGGAESANAQNLENDRELERDSVETIFNNENYRVSAEILKPEGFDRTSGDWVDGWGIRMTSGDGGQYEILNQGPAADDYIGTLHGELNKVETSDVMFREADGSYRRVSQDELDELWKQRSEEAKAAGNNIVDFVIRNVYLADVGEQEVVTVGINDEDNKVYFDPESGALAIGDSHPDSRGIGGVYDFGKVN